MRAAVPAIVTAGWAGALAFPARAWDGDPGALERDVAAAVERHGCASAGLALVGPAGAEWTAGVGPLAVRSRPRLVDPSFGAIASALSEGPAFRFGIEAES